MTIDLLYIFWPRSTMDSIRVSEAPDPGSIPGEATRISNLQTRSERAGFWFDELSI